VNAGPADGAAANGYRPAPFSMAFQVNRLLCVARANRLPIDSMVRVAVQHPLTDMTCSASQHDQSSLPGSIRFETTRNRSERSSAHFVRFA